MLRLWCPLYLVRRLKPAQAAQQPQLEHTLRGGAVLVPGESVLHAADTLPIVPDHQVGACSSLTAPPDLVPGALDPIPCPCSKQGNNAGRPL